MTKRTVVRSSLTVLFAALAIAGASMPAHAGDPLDVHVGGSNQIVGPPPPPCPYIQVCVPDVTEL